MIDAEQWRDVVRYEGFYSVSSFGRVQSKDREILNRKGARRKYKERFLKQARVPSGFAVTLSRDNYKETILVHRLVAEAFLGKCPQGMVVVHKDDNPLNNHLANIEYNTQKFTQQRFADKGRHWRGDTSSRKNLTLAETADVQARASRGESQRSIASDLGVSRSTIARAIARGAPNG